MKVNLQQILSLTGTSLAFDLKAESVFVTSIKPLDEAKDTDLAFFAPTSKRLIPELTSALKASKAAAVVLKDPIEDLKIPQIVSQEPLMTIMQVAARWFATKHPEPGISEKADVHPSASIGKDVFIGAFSSIGANTVIGDGSVIHPNVVIYQDVEIGSQCVVHSGAVLRENVKLGDDCQVQNGAVIGADGFGYKRGKDGEQHRIPHIGRVVIQDSVDFGVNSSADKGMLGDTLIGEHSKLDNLVQLGHNVKVGRSNIFCSQTGISGSTKIGNNCIFGGQSGVADHINIPDGTMIAAQGGVIKSPEKGEKIAGTPSVGITHWKRLHAIDLELPRIIKQLKRKGIVS